MRYAEMKKEGFYKVNEDCGTRSYATMFNPITNEVKTICVYDWDNMAYERENDDFRSAEINESAKAIYEEIENQKRIGQDGHMAKIGDVVRVVKGRKFPKGLEMQVVDFAQWYHAQSRTTAFYVVGCVDGQLVRIDKGNVEIISVKK